MTYYSKSQAILLDQILAAFGSSDTLSNEHLLKIDSNEKRISGLVKVLEARGFVKAINTEESDVPYIVFINPSGSLFLEGGGFVAEHEREQQRLKNVSGSNITITSSGNRNIINTGNHNIFHINHAVAEGDIQSLKQALSDNKVAAPDIAEIVEIVQQEEPANHELGPISKNWIRKMLDLSMEGTWEIGLATAGGLLTECLKKYYGI